MECYRHTFINSGVRNHPKESRHRMKKVLFATKNEHKMGEIREIFKDLDVSVYSLNDLENSIEDIEENGQTFAENAMIKAKETLKQTDVDMVLADDSGLEIDYLDKAPGILSARYLGKDTPYLIKNQLILEKLQGAKSNERSARFVCAIACAYRDGRAFVEEGMMEGEIALTIEGVNGFGYDPIFYLPEYGKTAAQLPPEEKNRISHRGKALAKMYEKIKEDL